VLMGISIRNKYVTENEFIGAIAIAASLGAYMIIFPIVFIVISIFYGWWSLLMVLLPILGLIGLYGMDYLKDIWYRSELQAKLGNSKLDQIFKEGMAILEAIQAKKPHDIDR